MTLLARAASWRLWAVWPLLALGIHLAFFPYLFQTTKTSDVPGVGQLIEDRGGYLGMFRSREIHVTYGRIGDPVYVARRVLEEPGEIGVATAHFLSVPDAATQPGPVVTAIRSRLRAIDSGEARRFGEFLRKTAELNPGDIDVFDIDRTKASEAKNYPIDKIVLVMLERNQNAETYAASMTAGLASALAKEQVSGTGGMIVTFLGLGPSIRPVPIDRFLDGLFDAIPRDAAGGRVFIGLFEGWPKDFLESVIADLGRVWERRTTVGLSEMVFALELRFALICLILCLVVCSFWTLLSPKNAIIISFGYLSMVFASEKVISFFFSGFDPIVVSLVVQIVLAMFFPFVAKLNPKGVFDNPGAD